jgi:catechol 2,3-dioxygenase-like lactoylglutathione lyase family enzyme
MLPTVDLVSVASYAGRHSSFLVVVGDLETSLRFYRDGLGLDLLLDRRVEGDWPDLFEAPSRRVRAVFLRSGVPAIMPVSWSSSI